MRSIAAYCYICVGIGISAMLFGTSIGILACHAEKSFRSSKKSVPEMSC